MQLDETKKALDKFLKGTIQDAKRNLAFSKKNASNNLSKSLKYSVKVSKNSIDIEIRMEQYGEFQDKGVSGTEVRYKTPYSYKSKMPPPRAFDKWIKKRGLKDEGGGLAFAIAKSIQRKGIKPSLFLTKAYQKNYRKLNTDITQKYGLDSEKTIDFLLKDLFK